MEISLATARAHYEKALALAKKEKSELAVLDRILEDAGNRSPGEIPLGIQDIHLEQIVGTKSEGRKNCFSGNFLPLMKPDTEFAGKWISLCCSHLNEGINTPVKVYEYMNGYYVAEGNKRVSVSKYFDTHTIAADVIRVLPSPADTPEYRSYCEYTDFYNLSGINYLLFSQPGCYEKLQELIGKQAGESWSADDRADFRSVFTRFGEEYARLMGMHPLHTVCKALLSFFTVFNYRSFIDMNTSDFRNKVSKYKEEFQRLLTPEPPSLETEPFEKKPGLIHSIVQKTLTRQKFAFIYPKNPSVSGWTMMHEAGRLHLETAFPDKLTTVAYKNTDLSNIHETLEKALAEGCTMIFTTSPIFLKETLLFAVEHPEIKFLNCNPQMSYKNVRTYYARMYEVKFLMGIIAGSMTENGKIGYIADYPILSVICDINAFALGAKMVNPNAHVFLKWSKQQYDDQGNAMTIDDIYSDFQDNGISVICDRDTPAVEGCSSRVGLYTVTENGICNLASPSLNWNVFYEKTASKILNGTWKAEGLADKGNGIRYWWGLSSGLVDILCSSQLPSGVSRLVDILKDYIIRNNYNPFSGRLMSQDREILSDPQAALTPTEILSMDWLAEGVTGSIPAPSSLNEQAKEVETFAGISHGPYIL